MLMCTDICAWLIYLLWKRIFNQQNIAPKLGVSVNLIEHAPKNLA